MRIVYIAVAIALVACGGSKRKRESPADSVAVVQSPDTVAGADTLQMDAPQQSQIYSNARFRDVTVEKTGEHQYTVRGEGQLFEATFGWVVEDGHNELKKGFGTASTGAPGWGSFEFTVEVEKERPNSTLMLILFEESAKDGSRQHELPVRLE